MTTFTMTQPSALVHTLLVLTASRDAAVELSADTVRVRLGLSWHAEIPRSSIVAARSVESRGISVGAHGWAGRWRVNTSNTGLIRLDIQPAVTARCLGVAHRLSELTVGLADPGAFLHELGVSSSV